MNFKKNPDAPFLRAIRDRVIVFDGAMGTMIQNASLTIEQFGGPALEGANDYLTVMQPQIIRGIHRAYLEAGADVVETNTFGSNRIKLEEYGKGEETVEVNLLAARNARAEADALSTPEWPRFVAGSLGPSGFLPSASDPALSNVKLETLEETYFEQAAALLRGGVDLLLIETAQDLLEMKLAIFGVRRAYEATGIWKPLQAQPTLDSTGHMLLGTDIASALVTLEALGADIIGLNCSTGPLEMIDAVRFLAERCTVPVSVIPNAGMPENEGGRAVYPMKPAPMAESLSKFVHEWGVEIVGGCCGTTPEHIRQIAAAARSAPRARRTPAKLHALASAITATPMDQEPKPLLIGERINSQGSRKAKQLLMADDYDSLGQLGRQQAESGAHALDICVALTERADERHQMAEVVKRLCQGVSAPLMVDTTEFDVAEAALMRIPGRPIINSINLEKPERVEKMMPHVIKHGAAVLAMTIDEKGMAQTAQRKLEAARKIHDLVTTRYGLAPDALVFDDLTFTLATGSEEYRRSAIETLDGLRLIKSSLPGVRTCLGVSNVSFGLSPGARRVLNSVFLYHAVQAGLDMAIVNAAEIIPYREIPGEQRDLAEALVFDKGDTALADFIAFFEKNAEAGQVKTKPRRPDNLTPQQNLHYNIVNRIGDDTERYIDECRAIQDPVSILNQVMLPAMKEVGDRFGAGELILPFVLQSAEVMKRAVAYLEKFLEKTGGASRGKVVLATVYGDVHDIGKNLVKTILSNNGYEVFDLGKQVPLATILDKAAEVKADAIGLSALLVSTSKQMAFAIEECHKRGLAYPILIGGAAINRPYARRISFPEEKTYYAPGVFYCKDAFEGLDAMNALMGGDAPRAEIRARVRKDAEEGAQREARGSSSANASTPRSGIVPMASVPAAPFMGVRVLERIPVREVFNHIDETELFRASWGVRGSLDTYKRLVAEQFKPLLEYLKEDALKQGYLKPRAVYGCFPVGAVSRDELAVFDPANPAKELVRFTFARQGAGEHLCLTDYYGAADNGHRDLAIFCAVTVGDDYTKVTEKLNAQGKYSDALYIHGLATQTAEALADWLHKKVLSDLGLPPTQGKRYSPGYPAWPDLADQQKLFALLDPVKNIGVGLTEAFQMDPEASTSNLIVLHPEATYYGVN